ncbi:MAG: hypothetical protein H6726_27250 [Sandaracinaceae bacterium]|nr:hypothetical protein [Sandaracinaceae bacterium]
MSDPSTEPPSDSPAAHTERWQEAVTRRVRALLRTAPLHAPERLQRLRDADLGSVDVRSLVLRALDVTIEEMGLGAGARRLDVHRAFGEMLAAGGSPLTREEAAGIADVVVDALLNEPRRTAFSEPYMDWSGDTPTQRQLEWKLLQEQELSDGRFVLQATTEGINVYTGMLEYDVRDAQVAEEAVLHAQVRRGRIRDAVQTARNARLRSIELQEQLVRLLKVVERDVAQLRWEVDIGQHLEASREHLGERMDAERKLRAMVSERRITASDADAPRLAELEDIIEDCLGRHMRLQGHVMRAVPAFLAEQERQIFRPRALVALPDLEADVLRPALGLPGGLLSDLTPDLLRAFLPAAAPACLYVPQLLDRLLAPPRQPVPEAVTVEDEVLELLEDVAPYYSAEDERLVAELLSEVDERGLAMTAALERIRARGAGPRASGLLVLKALHAFSPEGDTEGLETIRSGGTLHDEDYVGDELTLYRGTA